MATKYISLANLTSYDGKLKTFLANADKAVKDALEKTVGVQDASGNVVALQIGTGDKAKTYTTVKAYVDAINTNMDARVNELESLLSTFVNDSEANADQIKNYIDAETTARQNAIGTVPAKVGSTTTSNVVAYVDAKVAAVESGATADMKYTNTNGTTIAVGGIAKGTTFNEMDVKEIIANMLYPYVSIEGSSMSMTVKDGDTNREVGHAITVTEASVSFNAGSTDCVKAEIFDGDTSLGSNTNSGLTSPVSVDIDDTVVNPAVDADTASGAKTFTAKITDAHGTSVSSGSQTFTFYRPYYYGCAETIPTTAEGIKALTKVIGVVPNSIKAEVKANQYWVLAFPASYSNVKGATDANGFDVTDSLVAQTNITITGLDNKDVSYKVYAGLKGTVDATFTVSR